MGALVTGQERIRSCLWSLLFPCVLFAAALAALFFVMPAGWSSDKPKTDTVVRRVKTPGSADEPSEPTGGVKLAPPSSSGAESDAAPPAANKFPSLANSSTPPAAGAENETTTTAPKKKAKKPQSTFGFSLPERQCAPAARWTPSAQSTHIPTNQVRTGRPMSSETQVSPRG
eukprot:PhF_6_TR28259/c1_g1_i2/m.41797